MLCGDLNDEPAAATTQIVAGPSGSEVDLSPGSAFRRADEGDAFRMFNVAPLLPAGQRHTRVYKGRLELIDHIFGSHRLVNPDNVPTAGTVVQSRPVAVDGRRAAPTTQRTRLGPRRPVRHVHRLTRRSSARREIPPEPNRRRVRSGADNADTPVGADRMRSHDQQDQSLSSRAPARSGGGRCRSRGRPGHCGPGGGGAVEHGLRRPRHAHRQGQRQQRPDRPAARGRAARHPAGRLRRRRHARSAASTAPRSAGSTSSPAPVTTRSASTRSTARSPTRP